MRSIRSQLLIWLLPSFILIAILASSSLYYSEKLRLETNLDNELRKLGRTVKLAHNTPRNRFGGPRMVRGNIGERIKLLLRNESGEFYLQIWNEDGTTVSKSENLGDDQLSAPYELTQAQGARANNSHYSSKLSSGDDIRVLSVVIRVGARSNDLFATIAISKVAINQQLNSFAAKIILGSIFCCLLLSAILIFVIKRTLIPIHNLSEELIKVEAGSLDNRLTTSEVPAEISPLVERLNQLLARLEQSFVKERQFNNDLAHELRTPLAAIRTTSEVALKWPEQSSIDDHLYIAESSAQLQNTIDSLLSLARIEKSGREMACEKVHLATLVEECVALQRSVIKERGLTLTLSITKQRIIKSDPHLLRIIISNLVNNAVEYAPTNSEIVISNGAGESTSDSILTVENLAPNLSENDLTTMFDRLWRKDDSRTGTKHVGLGLSIAHTAAEALSFELIATLSNSKMLSLRLIKR